MSASRRWVLGPGALTTTRPQRQSEQPLNTAQAYGNERGVGEGIRTCGIGREKLFVVSKVAAEHKSYDSAAKSIQETLAVMGLDYLDMMIIHSPQPWAQWRGQNRYFEENREVWRALEDAYGAGKLRAIGVSNFLCDDLESLLPHGKVRPTVNQVLRISEICQRS